MTAPPATRRTLSQPTAYALVGGDHRPRAVRLGHAVAALRDLPRAVGLLAARPDAGLRDVRVRRARRAAARRPRVRRRRPPAGAARRARRAHGGHVLFMVADSVVWLFVARGVQGLATGLALGAASAALLDLHAAPRSGRRRADQRRRERRRHGPRRARLGGVRRVPARPARAALRRPVRALRDRLRGRLLMPEPVASRSRLRLTPQRPSVPRRGAPALLPRGARRACPRGRSAACSCRSARSSRATCSTPPTTSWPGVGVFALAGSAAVAQLAARAARRRGPGRPPARSRSPRAWC